MKTVQTIILCFFLLPGGATSAHAAKKSDKEQKAEKTKSYDRKVVKQKNPKELRKKIYERYEKLGMSYAKSLWMNNDGSANDELKSEKSNKLELQLRAKTIKRTNRLLKQSKNARLHARLYTRLAKMYEQQADTVGRLVSLKEKTKRRDQFVKKSIEIYRTLQSKKYRKYTKQDQVLFFLAENHGKLNKLSVAEKYYKQVIKGYPRSVFVPDALLAVGNIHFDRRQFTVARKYFSDILQNEAKVLHAYAHYKIAWCQLNQGNDQQAQHSLIRAIKTSRKYDKMKGVRQINVVDEALNDLVLFYAESGNPTEAKSFFEKIAGRQKAKELRYRLVKQYYEYSKHKAAQLVASQLLNNNPPKNRISRLLLISLSVAEQVKQRNTSLKIAKRLSKWIKALQAGKHKDLDKDEVLADLEESEDTLRRYSQKIHFEAQKKKSAKRLWAQAQTAYEIYLDTYKKSEERPEMLFRYSALLFHRRNYVKAYGSLNELIAGTDKKHKRYYEAMKMRIDAIESANRGKKKHIANKQLIAAYDSFVKDFPEDKLSPIAMFKAAEEAEKVEGPEKSAYRFRDFVKQYKDHKLVSDAMSKSVAMLAKAEKWETLKQETATFMSLKDIKADGGAANSAKSFMTKIASAHETAALKIIENKEKAYDKAKDKDEDDLKAIAEEYRNFAREYKKSELAPVAIAREAKIYETKLKDIGKAIDVWHRLKSDYAASKEAQRIELEIARLHEAMQEPEKSIKLYLQYGEKGNQSEHIQATTNAAVIAESLAQFTLSGEIYAELNEKLQKRKDHKKAFLALQSSCNNYVLAAGKTNKVYDALLDCSRKMAQRQKGKEHVYWLTRQAWTLEKLDQQDAAARVWVKVAAVRNAKDNETKAYIAHARIRNLRKVADKYMDFQFTQSNNNPEANLQRKSNELAKVENMAASIIDWATTAQIIEIRTIVKSSYYNFAKTLRTAAMPDGIGAEDAKALRGALETAALEMIKKAKEIDGLILQAKAELQKERSPAAEEENAKKFVKRIPETSPRQVRLSREMLVKKPKHAESLRTLIFWHYHKDDFAMARYFLGKLVSVAKNTGLPVQTADLQSDLNKRLHALDPVLLELTN